MAEKKRERLGDPAHTLYLIDISSFIFRAFFAVRNLKNRAGEPTNAVYGVATMLARLAADAKPQYMVVVYDSPEPSFRSEIFPEYKANRSEAPEDLIPQFDRVEQLIESFEIHSYRQAGVEADDLIATLTKKWCKASKENRVVVVSSDKDLMQLVDDRVCLWDTMSDKIYHAPEVEEKFGVRPDQIRDYLALVGDSSDNIPGVAGIGPKGAAELLKAHGDLDGVLKAAKKGEIKGKKGETLAASEDVAKLSAELATVHENLKIELDRDYVRYRFHLTPQAIDLMKELDFHTLVARWSEETPPMLGAAATISKTEEEVVKLPAEGVASDRFRTVNTEALFEKMLKEIEQAKEFGFDVETTSLNPRQAELVGIAICTDPEYAYYIPVGHRGTSINQLPLEYVLDGLRPYLESPKYRKIGQNLKYDWSIMLKLGFSPQGIGADTMLASYIIDPEGRHNLETLAAHYLNYNVLTYEQVCGKGSTQLCFDQVSIDVATRYSAEDAWVAVRLWHALRDKLASEQLMDVYNRVDLPLISVLAKMEREGVNIDVAWLKSLSKEFEKSLHEIEQRIGAYTQGPINLNSPKQLGHLLFEKLKLPVQEKTKTGYSTDAKVLATLAPLHEAPRLLLEYREISKLKGTYVDPLPELRDPVTGKIHTSFNQRVAATGRLSSSDPNLQNIPVRTERGQKIRKAFIPSPGNLLVSADYSQIELRILAHMSQDAELMKSFQKDEDVHTRTASEIFSVALDQVDSRQRGIAKAINFGLMYGKSAFALAQELKISRREAQDVIDRYFQRYSGVKRFLDQLILDAKERGYAITELGRKRFLPDINSKNPAIRNAAERMAMNTPIQGTAADMMKLAMIEIDRKLDEGGYKSRLIIQVHDEVVLDCPKKEVKDVQKLVCSTMEEAPGMMRLRVPLKVNTSAGENWMEL